MQDEDEVGETVGTDLLELISLTRNHISEVARLEGQRKVEVEVTSTTRKELVLLVPNLRVWAPALCEDGELLWSPPGASAEAEVVGSTASVVTRQRLPLEVPVKGLFLRQWGVEGAGPGQFKHPYGVAAGEHGVVVADTANHRMQVFGLDGTFVRQWGEEGAGPGQFNCPFGVVVVGDELIVCDYANHRIQVFGPAGDFVRQWGGPGNGPELFHGPCSVAVKGNEVIVVEKQNHRVQVFGLDGAFVRQWGGE